eukprot:TRINITY_DN7573_c0_g1_i1.p1 TRINITY_DN7573_c0_g1~~TRINITY_DN7573_c0_g1_i1.p1  ORF type:complete len:103 (-),score=20.86 TRINITY_DN7573_c0_g1_i1:182-490(-)
MEPKEDGTEPEVITETNVVGLAYVDTVAFYKKASLNKLEVECDISINLEELFDPELENRIPEMTKDTAEEDAVPEPQGCSIFVKLKIGKHESDPTEEEQDSK